MILLTTKQINNIRLFIGGVGLQPDPEKVIKLTLSGQIDDKIDELTQKYKQPFPEGYYYSWSSYKGVDPTSKTAIAMADIKIGQKDMIENYKRCKQEILAFLSSLDDEQIYNIKRYLEVIDEPIKGYQRNKARGYYKEIESAIDDEPLLYE